MKKLILITAIIFIAVSSVYSQNAFLQRKINYKNLLIYFNYQKTYGNFNDLKFGSKYSSLSGGSSNQVKKKTENDSDYYKSRITSGIGFTYLSNSDKPVRFLFSLYSYLNLKFITKYLYLGLGTDVFSEPKGAFKTVITINLIPTIGINLFKNKLSIFMGAGLCVYYFPISGSIFLFRADYNINNKFSIGIDIKRPYFGDQEFRDQTLLLNQINISLKF